MSCLPTQNGERMRFKRQNNDLLIDLSGIDQKRTSYCFAPDLSILAMREVLFLRETNEAHCRVGKGHKYKGKERSRRQKQSGEFNEG